MKKRFLCALLTLVMLVSLVPTTALNVSAAGKSVSESAITVLKQWNGYHTTCTGSGYIGYGTSCTVKAEHGKGTHTINEKQADAALRTALTDLDKAVNSFASSNGLSLTQNQHDALILFSFDNGTAWMTGTGSFRSAVVSRLTGNDFLTAICMWNSGDNDNRRLIEANMYLNGVYSSVVPSQYICVKYVAGGYTEQYKMPFSDFAWEKISKASLSADELTKYTDLAAKYPYACQIGSDNVAIKSELLFYAEEANSSTNELKIQIDTANSCVIMPGVTYEGNLTQSEVRYYDTTTNPVVDVIPTMPNHKFLGWYSSEKNGHQITSLKYSRTLYAYWQSYAAEHYTGSYETSNVWYIKEYADAALYDAPNGKYLKYTANGNLTIDSEFVDDTGVRWGRVIHAQEVYRDSDGKKVATDKSAPLIKNQPNIWIKLGEVNHYNGLGNVASGDFDMDVTVTVTNSYVRIRTEDSIYSSEQRKAMSGEQLRIVNTSHNDGFLWGQVANAEDECVGWVALMYTNYEEVKNQSNSVVRDKVIGNATIIKPVNGYVNLRSGAGTANQIVGALPYQSRVPLYEISYVNGVRWGRTDSGWFSLTYAEVDGVDVDDYTTNANVLAYSFVGEIQNTWNIHEEPNEASNTVRIKPEFDPHNRIITHLTCDDAGNTWGKIAEGWVKVSDAKAKSADVKLNEARYRVTAESVTVRNNPAYSANRVDTLGKGVEFVINVDRGEKNDQGDFCVNQIIVVNDSVWAQAYKFEKGEKTYGGWVNLTDASVTRVDAPAAEENEETAEHFTDKMATVINTDNVNVREYTDATYAKIGSLARGTTVAVWEEEDGWYKIDSNRNGEYDYDEDGWVSGQYLDIYEASSSSSDSTGSNGSTGSTASAETGLGIVANTYTGVNVRTGAGTGYAPVGKLLAGSTVEILEVKNAGSSKWGRVSQGWICMDYVTMIQYYPIAGASGSATDTNNTTTSSNTTANETVVFGGAVKGGKTVKVYKTTDRNDENVIRTLPAGAPVTIHELLTVEKKTTENSVNKNESVDVTVTTTYENWARINDGYIYAPGDDIDLDTLTEYTYTVTGVKGEEPLNVRAEAGIGSVEDKIYQYQVVSITSLVIYNGSVWGRAEYTDKDGANHDGWVSMKYLTRGTVTKPTESTNNTTNNSAPNTNTGSTGTGNLVLGSTGNTANQGTNGFVNNASGYRYTGKVIRTGSVNVRALPSQTAALTTTLKQGASLVIYETTISEGMAWGRCDAGWVYLYYVDLQPCNNAVDAKIVYNENTIIYTDANCSGVAGTYSRMSVVDIYEVVGSMCRTEQGWVHVDNLG